ncbi:MAG: hypothetical protein Q9163_005198 [Psora crenata]
MAISQTTAVDDLSVLPMDKDEAEVELEKVVFGDDAGFHESLKVHGNGGLGQTARIANIDLEGSPRVLDEVNLEDADDSDLFFLDSGPAAVDVHGLLPTNTSNTRASDHADATAWIDSDDERIVVSLASNPRLRKLRRTETEDVVDGKEYTKRLRHQFEQLYPVPRWVSSCAHRSGTRTSGIGRANVSNSSGDDSADDMSAESDLPPMQPLAKLLQNASGLTQHELTTPGIGGKLRPEVIDVRRLKDVGKAQPSAITSLSFHPTHPLLLTSGPSGLLSLFHISPHSPHANPLLTNLHLRATPLTTSLFLPPEGYKIFLAGRRRYFHIWDINTGRIEQVARILGHKEEQKSMERFKFSPCGRWMALVGSPRKGGGYINIIDAQTSQWTAEVRVEGKNGVADFEWWGDGEGLVVLGKGGEAVEYSLHERRVVARWIDEGAVGTTVIALGAHGSGAKDLGGDRWLAIGSTSGIVNVYDRRKWINRENVPARPKPVRTLDQLTTPTSHLAFSPDGQVLCMASRWKRDALRLLHLPSCTVYKNWPTSNTPLGRITAVGWSANSEMLGVGNEQGRVRLWEVRA